MREKLNADLDRKRDDAKAALVALSIERDGIVRRIMWEPAEKRLTRAWRCIFAGVVLCVAVNLAGLSVAILK